MADFKIPVSKFSAITEEEALDSDLDVIPRLHSYSQTLDFCQYLEARRSQLECLIGHHLGIPPSLFVLTRQEDWVWGSFNIILPIDICVSPRTRHLPTAAILRLPLSFNSGDEYCPGNSEEKLRCESATYIWLKANCPSIPLPRLLGMGFPGAESLTPVENENLWNRLWWHLRRSWAWTRGESIVPFFSHSRDDSLSGLGYLLLEFVVGGRVLSSSWRQHHTNPEKRGNLYRGIARVLLDLTSVPLGRIGSWTLDSNGRISLTNRPLLDLTMTWGSHSIPTGVPRSMTYTSTELYAHHLLSYQDLRMRHQLNAIRGRRDAIYQLSALSALRALCNTFYHHEQESNYVLTLPDMHKSNIIVDKDWNIVAVIDLEFAPVQPMDMVQAPSWLSDTAIEMLEGPALEEYLSLHNLFLQILAEEEESLRGAGGHTLSQKFREDMQSGKFWFHGALMSFNAFPFMFERHLQPMFCEMFEDSVHGVALMGLWGRNVEEFVAKKAEEMQLYRERVKSIFAMARLAAGVTDSGEDGGSSSGGNGEGHQSCEILKQPCITSASEESK